MADISGGTQLLDAYDILANKLDLQAGMRYADLGIGSAAHFIFPAANIVGRDGKVYGIDIMKGVLDAANARAVTENVTGILEMVWSDLEVYGAAKAITNESLDRVSLINVLYQTKEDAHVTNEANRMLKPGGRAIVIDWLPTGASFGPPLETRTSLDKVREMAKVVGWRELRQFNPSDYHFAVVFEK